MTLSSPSTAALWLALAAIPAVSATTTGTNSKLQKLLTNSEVVQKASPHHLRRLEEEEENGDGDNDNEYGINDLSSLYLKYLGCSFTKPYSDEGYNEYYEEGDNNNEAEENHSGDDNEGYHFVRFTLCSSSDYNGDCSDCSGEYAAEMIEFLNTFAELQQEQEEQACQYVSNHCYCSSGYWDTCLYNCYANAGLQNCMQNYNNNNNGEGQGVFELQQYLECGEVYNGNGNNNGNNNNYNNQVQFFVGPYCANNAYIYLAPYYDEDCTQEADPSYFMSLNYGDGFPFMTEPLMQGGECLTCFGQYQQDNNNGDDDGNNNNYYAEPNQLCEVATDDAAYKCDIGRGYYSGCTFLNTTLPCLDGRGCPEIEESGTSGNSTTFWYQNKDGETYEYLSLSRMVEEFEKHKLVNTILLAVFAGLTILSVLLCVCRTGRAAPVPEAQDNKRAPFLHDSITDRYLARARA